MKLDNQALMSEFYKLIEEDYPDLSYEQLKEVCFGPWRTLRMTMEDGSLSPMRLQYFGNFEVKKGRAEFSLKTMEKRYLAGSMSSKDYNRYKSMIEKYLENEKN